MSAASTTPATSATAPAPAGLRMPRPHLNHFLEITNAKLLKMMGNGLVRQEDEAALAEEILGEFIDCVYGAVHAVVSGRTAGEPPEQRPMVPLFLLSAILELDHSPREGLKLSRIRPDDPRVLTSAWRNPRAPSGLPERPRSPTPVPGPSRQPSTTVRFQDLAADSDGEEEVPVKEDGMDVDEVEKTPPRKTRKTASSKKTPGPGRTESAGTKRKRAPTPTRKSKGKQRAQSPEDEQGDNERAAGHQDEETEQEMDEEEHPKKKRAKGSKPPKGILVKKTEEVHGERAKFEMEYVEGKPDPCTQCKGFPCYISTPDGYEFKKDGTMKDPPPACDYCNVKKVKCEPIDTEGTFKPKKSRGRKGSKRRSSAGSGTESEGTDEPQSEAEAPPTTDDELDRADTASVTSHGSRRSSRRAGTPSRRPTTIAKKAGKKAQKAVKQSPAVTPAPQENAEAGPSSEVQQKPVRTRKTKGPVRDVADILADRKRELVEFGGPIDVLQEDDLNPTLAALRIRELQSNVRDLRERLESMEARDRAMRARQEILARAILDSENVDYRELIKEMLEEHEPADQMFVGAVPQYPGGADPVMSP
ncbi:uncharacterized protein B0H18DRAFT_1219497 [Fomitopsis serialis]|uniref:uncharacterized protein n=1 Tax=Fomitopsis serialis TaxID=139415 RepID=UPI00200827D2|nr:uncharacterized protein B0H18DRAFT_1219497 [Neoantrodia serialis]KAH9910201.1 hypothetical protein B0H18DRAFT_1219497 [Neoantrodia serialis]